MQHGGKLDSMRNLVLLVGLVYLMAAAATSRADPKRPVNCRKYVFAPACRGVAAKRIVELDEMMMGDDPNAYPKSVNSEADDGDGGPKSSKDGQGRRWYFSDHRRTPGNYLDVEKRYRPFGPDYDAIVFD